MATERSFVQYVAEQADLGPRLTYRKMFGEYALYLDDKVVAFACDNSLFIKPTQAVQGDYPDFPIRPPYPGGKPHPVIDELLDEPDRLTRLIIETAAQLPKPKPKKPKVRKTSTS
ncbi:MAG: TfoX/Sxy family protein [Acidihalobacter sp.]|jgi:TfoX/Sxy family transcriptional regulator of competence genes|uniref:TfoX/Sxy family protein n=1 Tax=Acidihalobacter sp. TaxID=1872108 RepID=UPI00307DF3ED